MGQELFLTHFCIGTMEHGDWHLAAGEEMTIT